MIELKDASEFIKDFEKTTKRKVYRFPFSLNNNQEVAILMVKCGSKYISLPYLSQGAIETQPKKFDSLLFPKIWEIRDIKPYSEHTYNDKVNFEINLQDGYNYTSNIRRKIRKSKEHKIEVKRGKSEELIKDFYFVYSKRMHEIGVPPRSKYHIRKSINNNKTLLFVAYKDNQPIGSASLQKITDTYYENILFASLSDFMHFYTSYALHHSMIEYSRENNVIIYSFGRSTKECSVYMFKKHFKAQETPLYWSFSHKTKSLRNNKWFFSLWKLLPYHLTTKLGEAIHKRIY
ncbi:MAG: peptidoglycan bridge formation glycyltransferase FemA/FemB family protein [Bacteroidales bacterium]